MQAYLAHSVIFTKGHSPFHFLKFTRSGLATLTLRRGVLLSIVTEKDKSVEKGMMTINRVVSSTVFICQSQPFGIKDQKYTYLPSLLPHLERPRCACRLGNMYIRILPK